MYSRIIFILLNVMMVISYPVPKFQLIDLQNPADDSSLTKDVMIMEDIQTHYENLVDEVISSHSEDFLLSMTWSMSKDKLNTVYRPQMSMLLANQPAIHDKCLHRMPHWIGKYLHDLHSKMYGRIAPMIQDYMVSHWPSSRWYPADMTTSDIAEFLESLNHVLLTSSTTTVQMDPTLALADLAFQLQTCQHHQQQQQGKGRRWGLDFFLWGKLFGSGGGHRSESLPTSFDVDGSMKHHFYVRLLAEMRSDLVTEMHDRIDDLIPLIQDDLHDRFVDA
ncbi:hypothetical protein BCR42DRAFT_414390 [Absidia repens]|uniref:Uncharacterized protein n=1 Tax=Absidia repens TaxID=90262 RepID=A0A1X2IJ28_9FUNG|nr:hypothetical protein BCR42DRAFT_414390 [Absidia repens]